MGGCLGKLRVLCVSTAHILWFCSEWPLGVYCKSNGIEIRVNLLLPIAIIPPVDFSGSVSPRCKRRGLEANEAEA